MTTRASTRVPAKRLSEDEEHIATALKNHLAILRKSDSAFLPVSYVTAHQKLEDVRSTLLELQPLARLMGDFLAQERFDALDGITADDVQAVQAGWKLFSQGVDRVQQVMDYPYESLLGTAAAGHGHSPSSVISRKGALR